MSSRRDLLKFGGAAFAGAVLGIGGWEALRIGRSTAKNFDATSKLDKAPHKEESPAAVAAPKKIIDTHVHVVRSKLLDTADNEPNEPDERDGELEAVA